MSAFLPGICLRKMHWQMLVSFQPWVCFFLQKICTFWSDLFTNEVKIVSPFLKSDSIYILPILLPAINRVTKTHGWKECERGEGLSRWIGHETEVNYWFCLVFLDMDSVRINVYLIDLLSLQKVKQTSSDFYQFIGGHIINIETNRDCFS